MLKEDLQNVLSMIDESAVRGCWKGDEFLQIGLLRQRVEEELKETSTAPVTGHPSVPGNIEMPELTPTG